MKVGVVGCGYVGLVTGACLAESGNEVACVDIDLNKIAALNEDCMPIYEPGLKEIVEKSQSLTFSTDHMDLEDAEIIFIAVGTPQNDDGSANLDYLNYAIDEAFEVNPDALFVIKSTVPVGTNTSILNRIGDIRLASNPEFLKEGSAIKDFQYPDRVVVGVRSDNDAELLHKLYQPFLRTDHPFIVMSPESAELVKHASNAFLATKISFINEIANLCEAVGADVDSVRHGMGHDQRIGFQFLFPGIGYGGSCFPKDIRALIRSFDLQNIPSTLLQSVDKINNWQKSRLNDMLRKRFGHTISGRTIAVWGLSFKPNTDDIREAPAINLIKDLVAFGCRVAVYDPEAQANARKLFGNKIIYCPNPMSALEEAEALCICTEWSIFRNPDFQEMKKLMAQPIIFDGRNIYSPTEMKELGFEYYSIGRPTQILQRS